MVHCGQAEAKDSQGPCVHPVPKRGLPMLKCELEVFFLLKVSPAIHSFSNVIGEPALLWKVYNIETGKIMKAGFESEDDAKDWLEERFEDLADEYAAEEMDQDEEEDWREANDEEQEDVVAAPASEEEDAAYVDDDDDDYVDDDEEESDEDSLDEVFEDEDDED
jgi:hypothetical protein